MNNLYYEAPSDEIFNEVKAAAIKIWRTYDDTYGYATGKIMVIESMENFRDSVMYIVGMFDPFNQMKLAELLGDEARRSIRNRLFAGGMPLKFLNF